MPLTETDQTAPLTDAGALCDEAQTITLLLISNNNTTHSYSIYLHPPLYRKATMLRKTLHKYTPDSLAEISLLRNQLGDSAEFAFNDCLLKVRKQPCIIIPISLSRLLACMLKLHSIFSCIVEVVSSTT